jgi:hypothetical protein
VENLLLFLTATVTAALTGEVLVADPPAAKSPWPIVVRESQGGIAGESVTEWKLEMSGAWTVATYVVVNGKEMAGTRKSKTGRMTPEQLKKLKEQLTAAKLDGVPAQLGTAEKVNPHTYRMQLGNEHEFLLAGTPSRVEGTAKANILGAAPAANVKDADQWKKAAEGIQAVIDATAVGVD